MNARHDTIPARLARTLALALLVALFALPLVWLFLTALAPADQTIDPNAPLLPRLHDARSRELSPAQPTYWPALAESAGDNVSAVLHSPSADFPLYLRNSLRVAILSVVGMTLSSAIVAYSLARIDWPGRSLVLALVLATMMIPFTVLMAPQYLLFRSLGWIGTFLPLWAPACFGGAFSIFLLRQFFMGIPRELDEAARIDGCGHLRTFLLIILPLARPALAVVALYQFMASWNDFAGPLVFLNHERMYTVALGLQMYQNQHGGVPWNLVAAASLLVTLPVLVVYLLAQRAIIEGVATQGLKE